MNGSGEVIAAAEFVDRLVAVCTGGDLTGLPRRQRDVAIVLASATLWMETGAVYTEREINKNLREWLGGVCPSLGIDEVTLRRELIDHSFLERDDAGKHYAPGPGPPNWRFADDIATLDPQVEIMTARRARDERKKAHLEREGNG